MFFKKTTFRNLSVKNHLAPAAEELKIKHRGKGKYELALEIASELAKTEMVYVAEGANFKCLSRNDVLIENELDLQSVDPAIQILLIHPEDLLCPLNKQIQGRIMMMMMNTSKLINASIICVMFLKVWMANYSIIILVCFVW